MAERNSTSMQYPRSNITLELWIPYVLIGASCVTFLAVHFWCYHKRNRIRYLRKRDEFRVKLGLIERRRITSVIMSRYQAEIEMAPKTNPSLSALHIPLDSENQVRQPMAYSQDVSLEDNVEVVLGEPSNAWRAIPRSSEDHTPTDMSSTNMSANTGLFVEGKTRSGCKEKGIQTEHLFIKEVNNLPEDRSGWKASQSIQRSENPTCCHKPEVIGIFNIPQRYAWGGPSLPSEMILNDMSKGNHFREELEILQPPFDLVASKIDPVNRNKNANFQDFSESDNLSDKATWMPQDNNSRTHKILTSNPNEDQISYEVKNKIGSLRESTSMAIKNLRRAHDLTSDTSTGSMSSPVSASTVFVYHGHSPADTQAFIDKHQHRQLNGSDSSENLESAFKELGSPQTSSSVSIDGTVDSPLSEQAGILNCENNPQAPNSPNNGIDSKTQEHKQIAQADKKECTNAAPKYVFNDLLFRTTAEHSQNSNLATFNPHSTFSATDNILKCDIKESSEARPNSCHQVITSISSPGPRSKVNQSMAPEEEKLCIADSETSMSVTV